MSLRGLPRWAGQSLNQRGRVEEHHSEAFIGIDTAKLRNSVAIAEVVRGGELRYLGDAAHVDNAALTGGRLLYYYAQRTQLRA